MVVKPCWGGRTEHSYKDIDFPEPCLFLFGCLWKPFLSVWKSSRVCSFVYAGVHDLCELAVFLWILSFQLLHHISGAAITSQNPATPDLTGTCHFPRYNTSALLVPWSFLLHYTRFDYPFSTRLKREPILIRATSDSTIYKSFLFSNCVL